MEYSFIIPVFNCKPYLTACVESIRAIGAGAYEILLIDDGSTDGSGALCDALAQQHPEVRVVHQPNAGASAARNRGIQESNGEKLLFIDADDSLDADMLRDVLADSRCDQAELVIYGLTFDYYYRGACYRREPLFYRYDGLMPAEDWGKAFDELFRQNSLSPLWNKVFKREVLEKYQLRLNAGMFLYEDLEFVLRYMRHCGAIWNVPKAIYHYRQSEDEGNAKRRLARISSLPEFLKPIEASLSELRCGNSAVTPIQTDAVLQQLYLTLAREKISGSDLKGIRQICRDFRQWSDQRELPAEASKFQQRLLGEKVTALYFANKKTALRHKIAVWVKSHYLYR